MSKAEEIKTAVYEAVGHASMCWNPRPGNQVFDEKEANLVAETLLSKIQEYAASQSSADGQLREAPAALSAAPDGWVREVENIVNDLKKIEGEVIKSIKMHKAAIAIVFKNGGYIISVTKANKATIDTP